MVAASNLKSQEPRGKKKKKKTPAGGKFTCARSLRGGKTFPTFPTGQNWADHRSFFFFFLVTRAASMCVCSSSRNTCRVSVTRERSQNRKKDERQKSTRRDHKTTCLVTAMSSEKTSSRTSRQTARKKQKTLRKSKRDLQMTGRQESTRWENRELTAAMMFLAQRIKRLK